ncbi:MAG: phosphotransferase [Luteitalea sp.]|nr:phosphotransferase [Luteitalea sp.]
MRSLVEHRLRTVIRQFQVYGDLLAASPYGSGHINDTYATTFNQSGAPVRYIVQRINHDVFTEPIRLMENVVRVTSHARTRLAGNGGVDISRRVLTLVPGLDLKPYVIDENGSVWRMYLFIEGARTYDVIETCAQARAAAKAFGEYQSLLADLPGVRLHETIPDFHHTRRRFDALQRAIDEDICNRAGQVATEIAFVDEREGDVDDLLALQARGGLPERTTHNDTKLNNVMIDDHTSEGLCVIDLDTTMPGLVAYDFGDLVRTVTAAAAEDERDLEKVGTRMDMFEALAEGYLSTAAAFLTAAERASLAIGAKLITLENGLRFLTDHLQGDVYFKTSRPDHNLDRARTQLKMVESIEAQLDTMHRIIERFGG